MNGRFIIVGAGTIDPSDLRFDGKPGDFLCAADAGFLALKTAGLDPDLVVGDFDSMAEKALSDHYRGEIIRLPVEKDDTDTVFCIREGIRRGYRDFLLLGALGGSRLSHTIANLQLLSMVKDLGGNAVIRLGGTEAFILSENEEKDFPESCSGSLSVFSLSEESELSLSGLYYPLERGTITRRFPLGVSNHFTGNPAKITVHRGEVLIITEP